MTEAIIFIGAGLIGLVTAAIFWRMPLKVQSKALGIGAVLAVVHSFLVDWSDGALGGIFDAQSWKLLGLLSALAGLCIAMIFGLIKKNRGAPTRKPKDSRMRY